MGYEVLFFILVNWCEFVVCLDWEWWIVFVGGGCVWVFDYELGVVEVVFVVDFGVD